MAETYAEKQNTVRTVRVLHKAYETSAADTAITVSTHTTGARVLRLIAVIVTYSGTVTKTATVTYNAAHGAAYDGLLATITITSGTTGSYMPTNDLLIAPGDAIDVTPAAGGGSNTSSVTILYEEI